MLPRLHPPRAASRRTAGHPARRPAGAPRRPLAGPLAAPRALLPLLLAVLLLPLLLPSVARAQQLNFQPLERGDYTDVEQKLIMLRGLEVGVDYALQFRNQRDPELPADLRGSDVNQDLRLNLDTVFHRDARVHLSLELANQRFTGNVGLRDSTTDTSGRLNDGFATALNVREAYLRYNFNPRSGLIMGKQELSLGDRRGMTFDALVPAFTFDCQVGTWCMPFGVALLGQHKGDGIVHWALQYNAYDTAPPAPPSPVSPPAGSPPPAPVPATGLRDRLQVEIFRLRYNETNVPLGLNLGPGRFNPSDPTSVSAFDPSQLLDVGGAGEPVYYDAHSQDYFGFRVNWLGGPMFANFDVVVYRGNRGYHLYTQDSFLSQTGTFLANRPVKGTALQTELGYRWEQGRAGLRYMTATGDRYEVALDGQPSYNRALSGYYEITPGSYSGTRLWFNGANTRVDLGGGLGHSVNNTRLLGAFFDWNDPDKRRVGYAAGIYDLTLNNPIPDSTGKLQNRIGVEVDNMLTWYFHQAIRLQFEANAILAGGAFRPDDFTPPDYRQHAFYQMVGRLVYSF
jgi:hypothetical protein